MTEITRVPLQPISKGSLTKLWIGVILAVLLGAGLAFAAAPKGLDIRTVTEGSGASPQVGEVVFVNYVGTLADGTEFDRSQNPPLPPGVFPEGTPMLLEDGALIPGFIDGLTQMRKGGTYVLEIPAEQAYGAEPPAGSPIPPNSDLTFEIEVIDILSRQDVEQRIARMQQMMGQGMTPQGGEGAPEGAMPAPPPAQ